jgi:hypothetical protein
MTSRYIPTFFDKLVISLSSKDASELPAFFKNLVYQRLL